MKKSIIYDRPKPCRVAMNNPHRKWDGAGKQGILYGIVVTDREWAIVLWNGSEDPDLFKAEAVEIMEPKWSSLL